MDSDTASAPGELSVRPAHSADYDRIAAVLDDWWGRPVRQVLPRLFLDHFHATSLVAERGGSLAGFVVGFMSPSEDGVAYIHFTGVDPALRGHGLARVLYERFFAMAVADGRRVVRAITSPANSGSIAFHAALGFTVTGPVPDYDGLGAAKVVFERRLPGTAAASSSPARRRWRRHSRS
jgi:predicted GNAT superfamily acetyltransferase